MILCAFYFHLVYLFCYALGIAIVYCDVYAMLCEKYSRAVDCRCMQVRIEPGPYMRGALAWADALSLTLGRIKLHTCHLLSSCSLLKTAQPPVFSSCYVRRRLLCKGTVIVAATRLLQVGSDMTSTRLY
jgi:hypothetical protein